MNDLKERLLALKGTVPSEVVSIPGVGEVEVRGLTAAGRDAYDQMMWQSKTRTMKNIRSGLLVQCLYHGGQPLFTPLEVDAIGALPATIVDDLYEVACRLSGMGSRSKEDAEGNSESAR